MHIFKVTSTNETSHQILCGREEEGAVGFVLCVPQTNTVLHYTVIIIMFLTLVLCPCGMLNSSTVALNPESNNYAIATVSIKMIEKTERLNTCGNNEVF